MKNKFAKAHVRKVANDEGLLAAVVGSTDTIDRYGESIDQGSWDLKHFKKNPVILWAHNLTFGEDRPPIGKAAKVKVVDNQLVFDIQFDMADPFAADIFRKYKEGFLNAFSVGFIPHQIQRYDEEGNQLENPVLRDNELLELSAVPVPANPEALNALRARSFKARSFDSMVKEAEEGDEKHEEENDEEKETQPEVTPTPPAPDAGKETPEEKMAKIAQKAVQDAMPEITKTISNVVKEAVKPNEDKGGSDSDPVTPQQSGGKKNLVKTIRLATKMLQGALAEANAEAKKS